MPRKNVARALGFTLLVTGVGSAVLWIYHSDPTSALNVWLYRGFLALGVAAGAAGIVLVARRSRK